MGKSFVSNKDESVRMFESDFMEFFSKVHWSVPLYIYIPLVFFLLYQSASYYHLPVYSIPALYISGILAWTLAEYTLHRYIFHYEPASNWGKKLHWTIHGVHHDYPMDSKRLVMPPSVSLPLAFVFFVFFRLLFGMFYAPFFAGFLTGYLFYDMSHYAYHHLAMKKGFWLKLKAHHMKHHYMQPDYRFGVSLPLWDYVFGTAEPKDKNVKG